MILKVIKKLFKAIAILLASVLVLAAGMLAFFWITEFKPGDTGATAVLEIENEAQDSIKVGDSIKFMAWNLGYGALGDNADFFMDGGTSVYTADEERVNSNLTGMLVEIKANDPDFLLLQEVDRDSSRSYHTDEYKSFQDELAGYSSCFANNFKVVYLPYPIPPIGQVNSGIASFSKYHTESAERVQLPIPFKWPYRMVNLKRCLIVSRIPVEGSDKELVVINLHLEAYDSGKGKVEQTKALSKLMKVEQDKGNYVIVGGDFNQRFSSVDDSDYPLMPDVWHPGMIDVDSIEGNWQFLMDEETPSCRSLDQPYIGTKLSKFQYYLIDGYIVSDNIKVEDLHAVQTDFVYSDHNPVIATFTLK